MLSLLLFCCTAANDRLEFWNTL